MNNSRENRNGGWRITAPLIGSIRISRTIVLHALVLPFLLAATCTPNACEEDMAPSPEQKRADEQHQYNASNVDRAAGEIMNSEGAGLSPQEAFKHVEFQYGSDNARAAFEKLGKTSPDGVKAPPFPTPKSLGQSPENVAKAKDMINAVESDKESAWEGWDMAVQTYGEANAREAYKQLNRTPIPTPIVKGPGYATPEATTVPFSKAEATPAAAASPGVKLYEELPPGNSAVTVTYGPLPPGWAPNEELQKAMRIPENTLLFLANTTPGHFDNKTNTTQRAVIPIIVGPTKASEADFRQGRTGFWPPLQAGSISATQLGPYRALLMQNQYGSGSLTIRYYYVPLADGWSAVIYLPPPGTDNSPQEAIAQGEALLSEAQSIAQGLRFQVNGKPVP